LTCFLAPKRVGLAAGFTDDVELVFLDTGRFYSWVKQNILHVRLFYGKHVLVHCQLSVQEQTRLVGQYHEICRHGIAKQTCAALFLFNVFFHKDSHSLGFPLSIAF